MNIKLSPLLQSRPNLLICRIFGWRFSHLYIFFLGNLFLFFNKKEKFLISGALGPVLKKGGKDIKTISKKVLKGLLAHYYEKLFIAIEKKEKAKEFIAEHINSCDMEILREKLKKGKGIIFITAHYGAIEYIPALIAVNELPVAMIAKFKTEHLKRKVMAKAEKDYDVRIIDAKTEKSVVKTAVKYLRQNLIVVTQCDEIEEWRPSTDRNIRFLGKSTGLDRSIDIIYRRTGAEIIFGVIHRFDLHRYRLCLYTVDQMQKRLGFRENALSVGETVIKFLELLILNYPEQWYQWKKYYDIKILHVASHSHVENLCSCGKTYPSMVFPETQERKMAVFSS